MINATDWYGLPAWVLENARMRVVIVPVLGAKIASLYDKDAGREWLLQPTTSTVQIPAYGSAFTAYEMTGFDEMFPTIRTCRNPAPGTAYAVALPDHGEVWALPWQVTGLENERFTLTVEGRVLNYRLERSAHLDENVLTLRYTAQNLTNEPMPYFWAAHPLASVDSETEIVLPPDIHEVFNVLADQGAWGPTGTRYRWPNAVSGDGKQWDLRRIGSAALHDCQKFNVAAEAAVSWAALRQRDTGASLRFDWGKTVIPYLGIWIDEGVYCKAPTIALEPMNGFFDGLDFAYEQKRYAELPPDGAAYWELRLTVGHTVLA